jgi:hypothetical protein
MSFTTKTELEISSSFLVHKKEGVMSNSNTTSTQPSPSPGGIQTSNASLSTVRYEPNFLSTVSSNHHPPTAPYEPGLSNLPYPMHRERNSNIITPAPRPIISNSGDTLPPLEKEPPHAPNNNHSHHNHNILPTVGPEHAPFNNEVMIPNQQPVASIHEPAQEGDNSGALVPGSKTGQTYVDITEYLNMPQSEAAKKLGIPTSTLSKRWKEAVRYE